jgi:two-component system response regulator FlrC
MGKKVLFADDDAQWRTNVTEAFKVAGYELLTATDGSEVLAKAGAGDISVIILELNLAGENGLNLTRFLRLNHPGIPVILLSDVDHDDDAVRSMLKAGAEQYLRKSTVEELLVTAGAYIR